jgi:hypothetical protein
VICPSGVKLRSAIHGMAPDDSPILYLVHPVGTQPWALTMSVLLATRADANFAHMEVALAVGMYGHRCPGYS